MFWHVLCISLSMKTAFSCWNDRIAPVFDTARNLLLIKRADGELYRETAEIDTDLPLFQRVLGLAEMDVRELVCGAVSRELQQMLGSQGITVIPFISGDLDRVIAAWEEGRLPGDAFLMPGCRGGRRLGRGKRGGFGPGPGGRCVCPFCGRIRDHIQGVPCFEQHCSHCGAELMRE